MRRCGLICGSSILIGRLKRRRLAKLTHRASMVLWIPLSLFGCTTLPPVVAAVPQLPPPPVPAECTRKALALHRHFLHPLPTNFLGLDQKHQVRTLLTLKALDAKQYLVLRAQAVRCAPETEQTDEKGRGQE